MKKGVVLFSILLLVATLLFSTGCDPTEIMYTLTIEKEGEGTVSPAVGEHIRVQDTIVDLEATPDQGWTFSHWVGDVADTQSSTTTVLMNADKTVKAVFQQEALPGQYTLTVEKEGEGTVTPAVGSHFYDEGETVNLEATPAQDWTFSHWVGDVADTQSSTTTVLMNADKTVKAVFREVTEDLPVEYISSDITSPTTWAGYTIYVIESNISVNALLTIEPGAIIKFELGRRMTISSSGGLRAEGTEAEAIIFTSIRDDEHGGDTNEDGDFTKPAPDDWEYIYINGGTALFDYCEFYYGGGNRLSDYTLIIDGTTTVKNSIFAYNNGNRDGALDAQSRATIEGNTFYGNVRPMRLSASLDIDDSNIFHNPNDPDEKNTFQGIFIDGSSVNRNVTWEATDIPFVISSSLTIGQDYQLTLGEGVIVKFDDTRLTINGRLNAVGVEEAPIIFTSYKDDIGGDSNGDEDFTSPAIGDWEYITINGTANFDYCEFYYGGGERLSDYTLTIDGTTTVKNSIFAYNNGDRDGALDAQSNATIEGNTFYGNIRPIRLNVSLDLDDSNIFHNPNDPDEKNTFQGIFIDGRSVNRNVTWEETEAPFVITSNTTIGDDYQLTLKEGVIMKFHDSHLTINGRLNATGLEDTPIIFTSYRDDTHGGDSNGDGGSTSPAMNDWEYITINGTANFDYCEFYYGGGERLSDYTLTIDGTTTVKNSIFAYNNGDRDGALDAQSNATIEGNTFYGNIRPIRLNVSLDLDDSNIFHNPNNPDEKNTFQGIFIDGSSLSNHVTWEETELAFVLRDGNTTIREEGSLTLGDGVVLKFRSGRRLDHHDNLFNYDGAGVFFTSYRDDSLGGDSNGDGDFTSPAEGDWDGIRKGYSPYPYETWENILYATNP